MDNKNLMTLATKKHLEKKLIKAEAEMKKALLAIGTAAGKETNWHDNAAFEDANVQFNVCHSNVKNLREKLFNVEIIKPQKETNVIKIGNTVVVQLKDKKKSEKFTILGSDDVGYQKDCISYTTPLSQAILGKKAGKSVSFKTPKGKQEVKIITILPGEFE